MTLGCVNRCTPKHGMQTAAPAQQVPLAESNAQSQRQRFSSGTGKEVLAKRRTWNKATGALILSAEWIGERCW
jgi:hypothetical protein